LPVVGVVPLTNLVALTSLDSGVLRFGLGLLGLDLVRLRLARDRGEFELGIGNGARVEEESQSLSRARVEEVGVVGVGKSIVLKV